MSDRQAGGFSAAALSRRIFMAATGAGLALAGGSPAASADTARRRSRAPSAPFDSLRDYLAMLEDRGLLLRFDGVDQDAYEATGIMYRVVDRYGRFQAPPLTPRPP